MTAPSLPRVYLVRHGETAWSLSGRHTGRTDIDLNDRGREQARRLAPRLQALPIVHVWSSPLLRAKHTCELAGLGARAQLKPELMEWHYGDNEGLLIDQIRAGFPHWDVFRHGCPGGESTAEMQTRVDGVAAALKALKGDAVVFSHGHFLRALAVRWVGLPLSEGGRFGLGAGSLGALGFERNSLDEPVVLSWNQEFNS